MKIALVHDDLVQEGGAESLFSEIAKVYPNAPIFTSIVDWEKIPKSIDQKRIRTSFIQKIPFAKKIYKALLPLYPLAFESFNFSDYDLILSSTTRFAKSIITTPKSIHICYINSVPRFLWEKDKQESYLPKKMSNLINPLLNWLAKWDRSAAQRVDYYIANSKNVQKKIKDIYGRDSVVIFPYADTEFFKSNVNDDSKNYFLVVSRLVGWKKIDIAIKTANNLSINLRIIGGGPDYSRLKSLAESKNVEFLGNISKVELRQQYKNAKALIVTQEEDFGIAAVEAQSCGIPVITYIKGGTAEIIIANKTGITFNNQSPESLKDAIRRASIVKWDHDLCRTNALKFTKYKFTKELTKFIDDVTKH